MPKTNTKKTKNVAKTANGFVEKEISKKAPKRSTPLAKRSVKEVLKPKMGWNPYRIASRSENN